IPTVYSKQARALTLTATPDPPGSWPSYGVPPLSYPTWSITGITNLTISGTVWDLYDWKTDMASSHGGCNSVLQTCFWPLVNRNEGKIFCVEVNMSNSTNNISIQSNDYDGLIDEYINSVP
ncbi:MAG: hypothetical protein PHS31_06790, partial [Victivallaceae bacterium]|nr:hypothetical protein [Victivallaceae bacterium]